MGRTIPSFRIALEDEIASWRSFKNSLSEGSKQGLDSLFNAARNHCSASSNAVRPTQFQGMFMAIVFEHERRLENMAREIEEMRLDLHVQD